SFDSTGRGIRQLYNSAIGDEETLKKLQEEENQARRLNAPLMGTGAGKAGNITGHLAQFAVPGGGIARLGKGLSLGWKGALGLEGALGGAMGAAAPTVEGESRKDNAVTGAISGAVLPAGLAATRAGGAAPSNRLRARIIRA